MTIRSEAIVAQIEDVLVGWTMSPAPAKVVAEVLGWADLHGIESHGISMLTMYDDWRRAGRVDMQADIAILRETPVSALIDGGGGLGHPPAHLAMTMAIDKAKRSGMAAVSVRHSSHYGACGYYTAMAAEAGLIGITTTTTPGVRVAPTGGAEGKLGTDPWSFSAPGDEGRPFLLDMATTTVAYGKIRNKANEGLSAPLGWVLDEAGGPSTDPGVVVGGKGFQTPLGGTADGSSHKGYGLSMMVNILSSCLSGADLVTDPAHTQRPGHLGHFFLALDPGLFRNPADVRGDVAQLCDDLRATRPIDPAKPVMVAGDPERAMAEKRRRDGIVIPDGLKAKLKAIAQDTGAVWRLN
ncbi:Ldh family oxidoreductase [Bosea sp. (in: a-proteobacteria)]|uniref:Ldh family oxidoreductase n=1 Tax=Bosea sp. (in: a-proteobacteria) TaxID=1871050 RepID=UPI00260ADEE1|nr:Ldh family oxidoreductase [Bosea sp. (in: a-proteobacteria)]MCO5090926.1 Ldh family oxidoreductase [Bosea sp. (in: a-proteobacteria)]